MIFTNVDLDKEEEYLHALEKGWRYRTSRFGFFYFCQCQPDDVIYRIYDSLSRFLKSISMNCKILEIKVGIDENSVLFNSVNQS